MGDGSMPMTPAKTPTKAPVAAAEMCPALASGSTTTSVTDHDHDGKTDTTDQGSAKRAQCPVTGQSICPNVPLQRGKDGFYEVPHPPIWPVIGTLPSIDVNQTIKSIVELSETYGRFFLMTAGGHDFYVCGSYEMVKHLNDEARFQKNVHLPLEHLRPLVGDALFTAYPGEPNWDIAHRVLVPVFGPLSLKKMQPMMVDVLAQMLMHWEHTAGQPFSAADQFTRLTLDTIALCGFRFRFNSFHSEKLHPFVDSMVACLLMSDERSRWPTPLLKLRWNHNRKYNAHIQSMFDLCDKLIAERRANPYPDAGDMLNVMLHDKDPKTGKHLSDENIRMQIITFLIAGHETTSGMLSFTMFYLLKNPRVLAKAREEADRLVAEAGDNMLNLNPSKATYIDWVLKESLRLQPTAPAYAVEPIHKDEPLPGDFQLKKGDHAFVFLPLLHRDPAVWDRPNEFYPERWEHLSDLDPAAYRPFGNGARACIGRGFAIMEGIIALIMVLHRFDLRLEDPDYKLVIKETLTIKPDNMRIIATPRHSRSQSLLTELAAGATARSTAPAAGEKRRRAKVENPSGVPLNILYGSNAGTCATLAAEMAEEASARGLKPFVGALDDVCDDGSLPSDGASILILPSYEGMPPDNARAFVSALERAGPMPNASYMVLGLGHPDWTTTYHRIPKLVDNRLAELGAQRLMPITLADASHDVLGDFEAFCAAVWDHLGVGEVEGQTAAVLEDVKVLPASANSALAEGFGFGTVVKQRTIFPAAESHPLTVETTVRLPAGHQYQAGDYLCVMPKNPPAVVERALRVTGLHPDDVLKWGNLTVRAADLFTSYLELGHTAPRNLLKGMDYDTARARHHTVLDLMEEKGPLPLDQMLAALPRLKPRHYSISSAPGEDNTASITYTVHIAKGATGDVLGVCSNYLASLSPGEQLQCATKPSPGFHLPPPGVPVVMYAAGSGIAPFMGFIASRARSGGRMILYFGCRSAADLPYAQELLEYTRTAGLDLRLSFSRSDQSEFEGLKVHRGYVQDRVRAEKDEFLRLVDAGAQFFVCGSSNRLGSGLKKTLIEVLGQRSGNGEKDMEALSRGRYKTDVFL